MEKMIAVGIVWGATNAVMRRGALLWDEALKSSKQPHPPSTNLSQKISISLRNWLKLLSIWQYSIPFLINLSASATFFSILSDAPLSLAVPVTNATTFASTALFATLLGEQSNLPRTFFGTALIIIGICLCINS
ncbi:putative transmembrane family 234 protein [Medicago truncatula]|uniref:Putative transmembrane family 234 protein n=1 Tax=Medicago truncatula TaxID=3880 RepID=G7L859_MEDTR|nr:transmembrane protein 234 homolog [Medicago truncatula]AET05227.1 transmembrane-like protein [Medicago truncatula]RHN43650.1 putative transmembrane family 234 protein [Medicago truncatula]